LLRHAALSLEAADALGHDGRRYHAIDGDIQDEWPLVGNGACERQSEGSLAAD
jgi:hypothetical protein